MSLRLDWCSYEAAKYAVEHWHYSGRLPDPKTVKIGVWEHGEFKGCVIFSLGVASHNTAKGIGIKRTEICELTRVALRQHSFPVSRVISIALKMLRRQSPGIRLVISYADPNHDHNGGIYQAGNWIFSGESSATPLWVDGHGEAYHDRAVSKSGFKRQFGVMKRVRKTEELTRVSRLPKYRYLMPLDREMRAKILPLAKPYPKRVRSETGDTAAVQAAKGGSTPTLTLQEVNV